MAQAREGDIVSVHYSGTLADGTLFDSSRDGDPLRFTLGEGQVIEGFETAVLGLEPGQSKDFSVTPEEAYGPHREELVHTLGREYFPEDIEIEMGLSLEVSRENGESYVVTVTGISDDEVTLDANHPLAGQTLNFSIELVAIG